MDRFVVEVREPGKEPQRVSVTTTLEVGRECNGLLIADRSASRRHVALTAGPHGLTVTDLGSANGTRVNGARITEPVIASVGDVIRVGETELAVADRQAPPPVPSNAPPPAVTVIREISRDAFQQLPAAQPVPERSVPHDDATLLLTDIALTPAQWGALDPTLARQLAGAHDETVAACAGAFEGAVVSTEGVGRMGAMFRSASSGVGCAVDILQRLAARSRERPELPVPARIAVHTAPVEAVLAGGTNGPAAAVLAATAAWQLAVSGATAAALGAAAPPLSAAAPSSAPGAAEARPALVDWQAVAPRATDGLAHPR